MLKSLREERHAIYLGETATQEAMARRTRDRLERQGNLYLFHPVLRAIWDMEEGNIRQLAPMPQWVLLALTEEVHLTPMEKAEILCLTNGIEESSTSPGLPIREETVNCLKNVLEQTRLPAYVADSLGYLLLANRAALGLYDAAHVLFLYDLYDRMRRQFPPSMRSVELHNVCYLPHLCSPTKQDSRAASSTMRPGTGCSP